MEVDFSFCCLQSPDSKDTRDGERMSGEESKTFVFYVYKYPALSLMVHTMPSIIDGAAGDPAGVSGKLMELVVFTGIYNVSLWLRISLVLFCFSKFLVDFLAAPSLSDHRILIFSKRRGCYINIVKIVSEMITYSNDEYELVKVKKRNKIRLKFPTFEDWEIRFASRLYPTHFFTNSKRYSIFTISV